MRHITLFLFAAATLPAAVFAQAETPAAPEYRRASLVERTPFAKIERGPARAVTGGPLELRGFFGSGKDLEVSITRTDTKEASWVKIGDTASKWVVESADPEAGTAEVRFEGQRLHLSLARAETGSVSAPAPEVKVEEPENRARRPQSGRMSSEARDAMRTAMRANMEAARKEHPEYFDGSKLTDEQQKARTEYFRAGFEKMREAVAKVSPEEAAKMENSGGFGSGRTRGGSPRGDGSATPAPGAATDSGASPAPATTGGEGGAARRGRGPGRGGNSDGVGLQIGNSAPAPSPAPAPATR